MVGNPSTRETNTSPSTSTGNNQPTVLITGLIAMRNGYLYSNFVGLTPRARATVTYCLGNSSSKLARIVLISSAVPAVPTIRAGSQMWLTRSRNFANPNGAFCISGE